MSEEIVLDTFTRLRRQLLQAARRLLPSEADAEDALQEAFIRLWPRATELTTASQAEATARTTIRNIGIDSHRRQNVHPTISADSQPQHPLADAADATAEAAESAEEQFQAVERIIQQRLTPLQQQILQWRDVDDRPYDEIACQLQMQPAAVRMQLSRARQTIRQVYREQQQRSTTSAH